MIYERRPGVLVDGYPHRMKLAAFLELEEFIGDSSVIPLREAARDGLDLAHGSIAMRHDVDHNLSHALKFATWEAARGWRSTYFVLPTAWYFDRTPAFEAQLLELRNLGHEVGLHVNYLEVLDQGPDPDFARAADWLHSRLEYLRSVCEKIDVTSLGAEEREYVDGAHLEIVGAAGHGDERAATYGISNLDAWSFRGGPLELTGFELEYEAYDLAGHSTYISDNHGEWNQALAHTAGKATTMLVHPCHWDIDAALDEDEEQK